MAKLTALKASQLKQPGRYGDGGGLYLQIGPTGNKSWLFRFRLNGRSREMGLGSFETIPLLEARQMAIASRRLLSEGKDPIQVRNEKRMRDKAEAGTSLASFEFCSKAYIEAHRAGWENAKHTSQWENTLSTYAHPVFGKLPVQSIDTSLVLRALEPIWRNKTETASRLRSRIELVLGWATAHGYRTGDNPARWRGHLDKLLPKPSSVRARTHHPAMPYDQVPKFLEDLKGHHGTAALALEFVILTGVRTSEALEATWDEFDLNAMTWTIPASRMKGKRQHRVPLTPRVVEILRSIETLGQQGAGYVFSGARIGRPLSNMALLAILRRMKTGVTTHGFRSSFRDWAAERTNHPREVAEAALAHSLKDKVEAAYFRSDLFLKRRRLMLDWSLFCLSMNQPMEVESLRAIS